MTPQTQKKQESRMLPPDVVKILEAGESVTPYGSENGHLFITMNGPGQFGIVATSTRGESTVLLDRDQAQELASFLTLGLRRSSEVA